MTKPDPSTEPLRPPAADNPFPKPTLFRFKTKRPHDESSPSRDESSRSRDETSPSREYEEARRRRRNDFHRNHFRRQQHGPRPSRPADPTLYHNTYMSNASSSAFFSPDTAFRESLFDALADDEGAAFWEGVYGQPIHNYPSQRATGPTGELEKMTEDEYVAFVRGKMWEKSHGYILEERARREEERKRLDDRIRDEERKRRDKAVWRARLEESLKRRAAKKKAERWMGVWDGYIKAWDALRNNVESSEEEPKPKPIRDTIKWPVQSGLYQDVGKEAVETFFLNAPQPGQKGEGVDLSAVLKVERVRWHPDKIQQRFGGLGLDQETVKTVTAVFQVVDRMWSDAREKQGNQGPSPWFHGQ